MKTIFTIASLLLAIAVQAQTVTRCVKNFDGSVTCTTTRGGGGF
jgi:hypothetical protein